MNDNEFMTEYFRKFSSSSLDENIFPDLIKLKNLMLKTKKNRGKIIIVGNGGSSAIASHVSVDLNKVVGIRSMNFNEYDLITCLANDYGYENWVTKAFEMHLEKNDLTILISSSGSSKNLINAAKYISKKKINLVTFTGFNKNNNLSKYANLSIWTNSKAYNIIENTHQFWLLLVCDMILGKIEYSATN